MITLRPYQQEPVRKAIQYFGSDSAEPSLIVLPTAWGKSILTAFVAASIPQYEKLLVVQPSKELLEQNYAKYMALCGEHATAGIYSASFRRKEFERITYATIGSIKDIGATFREMGFTKMLIDEAHLYPRKEESMLGKFLKDAGISQVLGITATPLKLEQFGQKNGERFDKWSELLMLTAPSPTGTFFKNILHVGQIQEMTSMGFWSPLVYEQIPFDTKMLRLNTSGSEYSVNSIEEAYKLNNVRANIYGALDYHQSRRHCLVFVPSVDEAKILADGYPDSAYISGDMNKKDREAVVSGFREGRLRVVFNVGVLSTGFDYPLIDTIILAFSTFSVSKYYQILGRGVRIHPDKKDCLVIDMGANVLRFGHVEEIRFEDIGRWRMYGSGNMLITGIPVNCIGRITREDITRIYSYAPWKFIWQSGKYKGKDIRDTPVSYLTWMLTNPSMNLAQHVSDAIIKTLENHVRDTRNEPPEILMPDGKYAGTMICDVPKNYLAWYYNSKEWNECNDSLKRGLELAYGGIPPYFSPKKRAKAG
ncbi:MAG: DUF3820 family protein [Bacteroidales bacterium]|nr:DUF3820 family protein [Bacteroidales bacterium]